MTLANVRYKDSTRMDLKTIKFPDVNWIYVAPDVWPNGHCVNMVMGIRALYKEGNIIVCEM